MTRRRLTTLAEQLRRIEDLAQGLAQEIHRGRAVNSQATRDIAKRIRTDAMSVHATPNW